MRDFLKLFYGSVVFLLCYSLAFASPPPPLEKDLDEDFAELPEEILNYRIRNGFTTRVEIAKVIRKHQNRKDGSAPAFGVPPIVREAAVHGKVEIPVLPFLFSDSKKEPFSRNQLQKQLYGNQPNDWSITTHYKSMSYGLLNLTGEVRPWVKSSFSREETNADLSRTLIEILEENDKDVNFANFDNDGPDGKPNSGDDDGIVDFIAFVQPNIGNECGKSTGDIHSHKYTIGEYITNDQSKNRDAEGNFLPVRVAEYLINPAISCNQKDIIEIGVFTHEYGHAFGLPDLYNTNMPRRSSGVTNWGLMGAGSWGGDYQSPDRPTHMLAWSKEYLGWIRPLVIEDDTKGIKLRSIEGYGDAVRIDYSSTHDPGDQKYLLISYRKNVGFDQSLPGSGLLITEIHDQVVAAGMLTNQVNTIAHLHGVNVIPANGVLELHTPSRVAKRDHLFLPSIHGNELPSTAAERLGVALCNIREETNHIEFEIKFDQTSCEEPIDDPDFGAAAKEDTNRTLIEIISSMLKQ